MLSKPTRVVVIEDETLVRKLLLTVLEEDDRYQVVGETGNGEEAFALCLQNQPDLVITDIQIPGIDGIELTRRLLKALPNLKILALSAQYDPITLRQILTAGVHGYLDKHQTIDVLQEAVNSVLNGDGYFSGKALRTLRELSVKSDQTPTNSALSKREKQILALVAKGKTIEQAATMLHISQRTVQTHRYNIMKKLDIHSVAGLTRYALQTGLLRDESND